MVWIFNNWSIQVQAELFSMGSFSTPWSIMGNGLSHTAEWMQHYSHLQSHGNLLYQMWWTISLSEPLRLMVGSAASKVIHNLVQHIAPATNTLLHFRELPLAFFDKVNSSLAKLPFNGSLAKLWLTCTAVRGPTGPDTSTLGYIMCIYH